MFNLLAAATFAVLLWGSLLASVGLSFVLLTCQEEEG
jgi:hypothetical protein